MTIQKEELSNKENLCLNLKKERDELEKVRSDVKEEAKRLVIENGKKAQELKKVQSALV